MNNNYIKNGTTAGAITTLAVCGLLSMGLAIKGWRAISDAPPDPAAAISRVQAVMAAHDWQPLPALTYDGHIPMTTLPFHKSGCPRGATIVLIGDNVELQQFAKLVFKDDVAFLQDGHRFATPSPVTRHVQRLISSGQRLWRGPESVALPILAVTPAPTADPCTAPAAHDWLATMPDQIAVAH